MQKIIYPGKVQVSLISNFFHHFFQSTSVWVWNHLLNLVSVSFLLWIFQKARSFYNRRWFPEYKQSSFFYQKVKSIPDIRRKQSWTCSRSWNRVFRIALAERLQETACQVNLIKTFNHFSKKLDRFTKRNIFFSICENALAFTCI